MSSLLPERSFARRRRLRLPFRLRRVPREGFKFFKPLDSNHVSHLQLLPLRERVRVEKIPHLDQIILRPRSLARDVRERDGDDVFADLESFRLESFLERIRRHRRRHRRAPIRSRRARYRSIVVSRLVRRRRRRRSSSPSSSVVRRRLSNFQKSSRSRGVSMIDVYIDYHLS